VDRDRLRDFLFLRRFDLRFLLFLFSRADELLLLELSLLLLLLLLLRALRL